MVVLMKRFRLKNKGITLVELIITVAIMTIVGGAITSFVVVAQKNYNSGSADTDLQYEAQMVVNQLQDLIIDTARGISYQYNDEAMSKSVYILDESEIPSEAVTETRSLYIYDQDVYYELKWDPDSEEVRFLEYDKDGNLMPGISSGGELLAQFVTAFSVDLRDLAENRTVTYVLTLSKDAVGKTYTTSHKIKLRNEILVNVDRGVIYVPEEEPAVIDSIIVSPSLAYVWPGESVRLSHRVTSSNGVVPSQSVAWEIAEYKDADGNVLTGVSVDAATDYLSAALDAIRDADHKLSVTALKTIPNQADPMRSNSVAVLLRGITKVTATDNNGCTSTNEAAQNIISAGRTVTATASFAGYNLEDGSGGTLSNTQIGGTTITVTEGNAYIDGIVINEGEGKISFTPKSDLDFSKQNYYYVTIHFQAKREGFTGIGCDLKYAIKKSGDFDIEVPEGAWKRNGYLHLNVENLEAPFLTKGEDGSIRYDWTKINALPSDSGFSAEMYVDVVFYYNDGDTRYKNTEMHFSSNGSVSTGTPRLVGQGAFGTCLGDFENGDLTKIKIQLLPLYYDRSSGTLFRFAYSTPYYAFYPQNGHPAGGINWESPLCANEVDIKITYGAGKYAVTDTITMPIEEVAFGYRRFLHGEAKETWSDPTTNEYYTVYVSTNEKDSRDYKVYYKMLQGWEDGDEDIPNVDYKLYKELFVGIQGNEADFQRYEFSNIEWGNEGDNSKGENYLKFTLGDILPAGSTVTVKYEYYPLFGYSSSWEESVKWFTDKQKKIVEEMTGCPGGIKFVFVDPNIIAENVEVAPVSSFCPDPDTLDELAQEYYYVSEEARFAIHKDNKGNPYLIYEIKKNDTWSNPWNGRTLSWNAKKEQWILNNVVIRDTDGRTRPSVLYCLPFTEDHESEWTNGRFRYYISETEYYELIKYTTAEPEIRYVNTKDNSGWGDATLYWDSTQKVWTQKEDNVKYNESWATEKPSIAYCPAPDALTAALTRQSDGLYYYRFGATEYYVFDPDTRSIYYARSSSSSGRKDMKPVWGKNNKLFWDDNSKTWTTSVNVIITDDREKPSGLYCPDPTDKTKWQWWWKYYYKISETERFLLEEYHGSYRIRYQKRDNNYYYDNYYDVWRSNQYLYWDATQKLWMHN